MGPWWNHIIWTKIAPWELICSTCHTFPFRFPLPWAWLFLWRQLGRFLEKQGTFTHRCAWYMLQIFRWVRFTLILLLLCIVLVILCSLLCFSVFHVGLSMDCILLISTRILVPLITKSKKFIMVLYNIYVRTEICYRFRISGRTISFGMQQYVTKTQTEMEWQMEMN